MSTVTLAESAKLCQNLLVQGVIENVLTVNRFFEVFPFREIEGNAIAYNRENVLGDVQMLGVAGTVTAKTPASFTQLTSSLTKIIGDAEVDYLIQSTRSGINDQKAVQIASKAKSIARKYQDQLINGAGTGDEINGLLLQVSGGQTITAATNGAALSFDLLDQLLDKVTDKDGQVDFIMMHRRTIRSYYALLRTAGGAQIAEYVNLPSGNQVPAYRGVPIFANDWLPITQTQGTSTAICTSIFAGTFDDGSMTHGIAGLTAMGDAGIRVQEIGPKETSDDELIRLKFYCGLAVFSDLGLAMVKGINN
jgi:HK97 family phage major capsid protein